VGKTNRLLSFDTTRTAQKKKKLRADTQDDLTSLLIKIKGGYTDAQAHRQQGNLISFLAKIGGGGGYADRQTDSKVNS
jgi:hypothetical protein